MCTASGANCSMIFCSAALSFLLLYAAAPSRGVSSQTLAALRGGHFLFGGGPARSFPAPFDERAGEAAKPVLATFEIAVFFHFPFVKIQRAADLDLQSMHPGFRLAIEIGRIATGIGGIPRHRKAECGEAMVHFGS